jgi:C4-dicarboxylate-specific signal transduction histidine kinase
VYDNDTKNRFRSLYSIPLRIGEEDIGVLKVENKSVSPFYFTDSDERLFDMIGRLIAIGVKYDNEQYLGSMLRAAELGFLASGIAHEFKNYLQRFTSIGSLISNQGQISEIRSYISDLQTQIQMASQSIDSFKLIRNRKAEVETFNIDQLVRQIIDISSVRVRNSEIEFEYINKGVEMVTMNPAEVQTILINLLRNAFEAVSDIRVDRIVQLKIHEEKGKVIFEIADSGGDLDPKIAKHMFAPYYTTKMMGMGMGLFWVREIVERNHGVVSHYPSKNFRGTTFRVELPNIIKK